MAAAIDIEGFTKRYANGHGVFDLDLRVDEGEWFGFIGENGAGKSTTIRSLLGLQAPTAGALRVFGADVHRGAPHRVRAAVGYVPSEPRLWDGLSVQETLEFLGGLHGADSAARRAELLDAFELDPRRDAGDLSLGNTKKVALVAALQHRPRLLVLDEPTSGLDPLIQQRLFEILRAEQERGATVFFSSHVLSEVERVCSRVAILKRGRLVRLAALGELKAELARRVEIRRDEVAGCQCLTLPGVRQVVREGECARFCYDGELAPLLRALADDQVADVRIERPSLEDVVLEYYGRDHAPATKEAR